ncbi:MAG: hypothetical protein ACRDL2_04000 [Gaiellaceae bacterium]
MTSRLPVLLASVLAAAIIIGAVVALNVLLLGRASAVNDPVGHLSARTNLPAAPAWTVRPVHGEIENDGADD